jgi:hypothetical protein
MRLSGMVRVGDVIVRVEENNGRESRSDVEIKNFGNIPRLTLGSEEGTGHGMNAHASLSVSTILALQLGLIAGRRSVTYRKCSWTHS